MATLLYNFKNIIAILLSIPLFSIKFEKHISLRFLYLTRHAMTRTSSLFEADLKHIEYQTKQSVFPCQSKPMLSEQTIFLFFLMLQCKRDDMSHTTLPLIHFSTFDNIIDLKPFHAILNQFAKYGLANFIGRIFASVLDH